MYTDKLLEKIDVQQIVLEEFAKFPEVTELVPLSKVKETKAYTSIKSEKSATLTNVGDFKYLGDDEKKRPAKMAAVEKVLREKLGANGYAYIDVHFGYALEDGERIVESVLPLIKVDKGRSGKLHPSVFVEVRIMDKDGLNLSLPYSYQNGVAVKSYESPKEAKKAEDEFKIWDDYCYSGSASGEDFVMLEKDDYDAEAFYALYTEELVRQAMRNAALRTAQN